MKTKLKPGRKFEGLRRPLRLPLVLNQDEKDFLVYQSQKNSQTMSDYIRNLVFPNDWRETLELFRREAHDESGNP
jgi:hypothetical protein